MALSIGEAAKAVAVSKSTLSRAIKGGRISAEKQPDGSYSIDPAELFRVYPPPTTATVAQKIDTSRNGLKKHNATMVLDAQLEVVREQLRDRDETIADLRRRLDQSEGERREAQARIVGLLSDQRPAPQTGFWARVFGGGSTAR